MSKEGKTSSRAKATAPASSIHEAPQLAGNNQLYPPRALRINGAAGECRVLCLQKRIRILKSYSSVSDGGRSSTVEPQIVVLVVAGSNPVGHPIFVTVPVAQPDRASDFGSEGWGFESLQARHLL